MNAKPILPSATGLTHVTVYDSETPDGQCGGCPHMHLACTELYYTIRGHGVVEFLSAGQGFQRISLHPGKVVYFTPGVLHRLINEENLEILVLMENSGLPELGDVVLSFPPQYLDDPIAYRAAQSVHDKDAYAPTQIQVATLQEAQEMRDLAVIGFNEIVNEFNQDFARGEKRLAAFHRCGINLVKDLVPDWSRVVTRGVEATVTRTRRNLEQIENSDPSYLSQGWVVDLPALDRDRPNLSMCGFMWPYLPEGAAFDAWGTLEIADSNQ